jgi:hypothetical protein
MCKLSVAFRLLACLGALLFIMLLSAGDRAQAQSRVALVVGNSNYTKVGSLPNPVHDSQDVAAALGRLGFMVNNIQDADYTTFNRALRDFNRLAPSADIAVIYFAGHGIEVDGENWLLPTDVELHNDVDAGNEAIALKSAMVAVGSAHTLGLVILDACRNNPFESTMQRVAATRGMTRGLARIDPFENVLVAYAARDGTTANDGNGRNSPFTAALLRHLETPGLEIDFLFRNVRDDVRAATKDVQQPFVYGSLSSEEIYLKPPVVTAAPAPARAEDAAEIAWSFLKATGDIATITRFTERFPESPRVTEAKSRIGSLQAVPIVAVGDTGAEYKLTSYIQAVDTGFEDAEMAVAKRFTRDNPAIEEAWNFVKDTTDHKLIRRFVEQFPNNKRRVVAETRLADLGQAPLIAKPRPRRPALNMDNNAYVEASRNTDVIECYLFGNQNDPSCLRAYRRFPEIARFPDNPQFLQNFCAAIGKSTGCAPSVKSDWNFPGTRNAPTDPNGNGGLSAGGTTTTVTASGQTSNGVVQTSSGVNADNTVTLSGSTSGGAGGVGAGGAGGAGAGGGGAGAGGAGADTGGAGAAGAGVREDYRVVTIPVDSDGKGRFSVASFLTEVVHNSNPPKGTSSLAIFVLGKDPIIGTLGNGNNPSGDGTISTGNKSQGNVNNPSGNGVTLKGNGNGDIKLPANGSRIGVGTGTINHGARTVTLSGTHRQTFTHAGSFGSEGRITGKTTSINVSSSTSSVKTTSVTPNVHTPTTANVKVTTTTPTVHVNVRVPNIQIHLPH